MKILKNNSPFFYGIFTFFWIALGVFILPIVTAFFQWVWLPWSVLIYDAKGQLIVDIWNEYGYWKSFTGGMNTPLIQSIIQIEDGEYFSHWWVDIPSKIGAFYDNIQSRRIVRGWSTITEQWIKNEFFPYAKRTWLQKCREATLAFFMSLYFSKEEILSKYVNSLYLGNRIYWIQAASEVYFHKKDITQLTESEISFLIALIRYPWIQSLQEKNFQEYLNRVRIRLWVTIKDTTTYYFSRHKDINLVSHFSQRITHLMNKFCTQNNSHEIWNYLQNWIEKLHEQCDKRDKILFTPLMYDLQKKIEAYWVGILRSIQDKNVQSFAAYVFAPKTHKVLVYIGNTNDNSIDGAQIDMIQQPRSVGSILKPFLYLFALESWAEIDSLILDGEKQYDNLSGTGIFLPQNYNLKEYGPISLKYALASSLNLASVRLTEFLWLENVYHFFEKIGFRFPKSASYYGYGFVLGAPELTLEEVALGYSALTTLKNKTYFTQEKNRFLLAQILSNPYNRRYGFWVNSILNNSYSIPVKTGTSTDFRDNWALGYTNDFIFWVWVWNTNRSSMRGVTWVTGAWPIWHFMAEELGSLFYADRGERWVVVPDWIEQYSHCLDSRCFRTELSFTKTGKKEKSSIIENTFFEQDFFISLSDEEKKRWNIQ